MRSMGFARARIVSAPASDAHQASRLEKGILLAVVTLPLVATALAVLLLWNRGVTALDLAIFGFMYVLTAMGIGVGFHRMLTHRSFESDYPAVRYFFLALGSMALQGPAVEWAATHVKHHAKSDKEGDPHSPLEGFWHAHVGWLFRDRLIKSGVWAKPFENDKVAHAVDRQFWLWAILSFAVPGALGLAFGHTWHAFWTGVLWGGLVRLAVGHHVTWSVNSVCHTFGRRDFESQDESRNEWVVGILGLGEGWHNNHHAFPKAAYHGMRWWQIDFNAYVIRLLKRVGLVRNVWMPKAEDMEARRVRKPAPGIAAPAATFGLARK
jgi:stearoyl-CoA desaturase (Delta-9 desaturase)